MKVRIAILTLNAEKSISMLLESIKGQKEVAVDILVIDSSSIDQTVSIAKKNGCSVKIIPREKFDHGNTRQIVVEDSKEYDLIVFLTQDVILVNEMTLKNLLSSFRNREISCAYGRQIAYEDADVFERFSRLSNYPPKSMIKSLEDKSTLGIKTVFFSDSFSAYRRDELVRIGGFPRKIIFGEDMYIAAKLILDNRKIAYCADAQVYHSHNYTLKQVFKRCFDIGAFHSQEPWIQKNFGSTERIGIKFVLEELKYIYKISTIRMFFYGGIRIAVKYFGYILGKKEKVLPRNWKKHFSMNYSFWISNM